MKHPHVLCLALLAVAFTAACGSQTPSPAAAPAASTPIATSADPEAEKAAVAQVMDAMSAGWNAHDMDAFGAVFRDGATFINIFGHVLHTPSMIIEHHKKLHERNFRETQIIPTQTDIRILTSDVAVVMMNWRLEGARDPRTDEPVAPTVGFITATLTKKADGWKIEALQNTQTVPIPGPPSGKSGKGDGQH